MKKDSGRFDNYAAFYNKQNETVILLETISRGKHFKPKNSDKRRARHRVKTTNSKKVSQPSRDPNNNEKFDTHDFSSFEHGSVATSNELRAVSEYFPSKCFMKRLDLIYSTSCHGFSLKTLYRKCDAWCDTSSACADIAPCIFVISDTKGNVFGAVSSCIPKVSNKRYKGTGESMLFAIRPTVEAFHWTGFNDYFSLYQHDSISFGGSINGGQSGIWLDGNLLRGRTMRCETFNNNILSAEEDFEIFSLEIWGFQ